MPAAVAKVRDILKTKGPQLHTVRGDDTLETVSRRLKEARVGVMVVSNDGKAIAGIISERDLAYGLCSHKSELHSMPASTLMTTKVITCSPDDELAAVARTMGDKHIRHLPVVYDGELIGVVGMRDVMIYRLSDMERTARLLGSAISMD